MSGTITYVGAGDTFSGYISPPDEVVVEYDGTTGPTDVAGIESVLVGGSAFEATVEAGGTLIAQKANAGSPNAAQVYDAVVKSGGTFLDSGYSSRGAIYGVEDVFSDPMSGQPALSSDTVYAGGAITFGDFSTNYGCSIEGGTIDMTAPGSGMIGATNFVGPGGLLELSVGGASNPDVAGFGTGDYISIAGIAAAEDPELTVAGDNVTISNLENSPYSLIIEGASSDDLALTTINGTLAIESLCFLAGTLIATPDGSRAIETLRAGDLVLTSDGRAQPVRWLGRQTVATRFADPMRTAPIRIRRDALGDGLPARDLHVSPDHALMVDGVFVQAGALVNGVSITREDRDLPDSLVYYHVELADHSLILAEGVPAETFIDNVDRLAFDNWDEHAALNDDTAPMCELPHPRAKAHRQVPAALRARLLARGCALAGQALAATA